MNSPPILEPILVVGLVDVHWGYDLDFDPWPQGSPLFGFGRREVREDDVCFGKPFWVLTQIWTSALGEFGIYEMEPRSGLTMSFQFVEPFLKANRAFSLVYLWSIFRDSIS